MNRHNYLDENVQMLVESTEPELKLPEQVKVQVFNRLAEEAEKSEARKVLIVKAKRACISMAMASAVAAMIVVTVFTIVGPGTKQAVALDYTIEDTIKALRKVSTVHTICTDWSGRRFETWAKIDPQNGKTEWACVDNRPHGGRIVASTADGSCVWDKNGDVIKLTNKIMVVDELRYARLFQELSQRQANPLENEKVDIYEETDPNTGDEVIVIWSVTKLQDFKIYVDRTTKLPLRMHFDRADNMMQVVKTVDWIYYNVDLPMEFLDFEIPPGAIEDFSVHDDPNKGMPADELTHQQASVIIVRKYLEAVIAGDWETRKQLRPLDNTVSGKVPAEVLEIGKPYSERGYTGLIVPCKVRKENGELREYRLVVRWRVIDGKPSCIIVAMWGEPMEVDENRLETSPK